MDSNDLHTMTYTIMWCYNMSMKICKKSLSIVIKGNRAVVYVTTQDIVLQEYPPKVFPTPTSTLLYNDNGMHVYIMASSCSSNRTRHAIGTDPTDRFASFT